MKQKKFSTNFTKLSNLILSLSDEQQEKLLDLASRLQNGEHVFLKSEPKKFSLYFSSGLLAGTAMITVFILILLSMWKKNSLKLILVNNDCGRKILNNAIGKTNLREKNDQFGF